MKLSFQLPKRVEEHACNVFFDIKKPVVKIGHGGVGEFTVDFTDEKAVLTPIICKKEKDLLGPNTHYRLPTNNGVYRILSNGTRQVINQNGQLVATLQHFPQHCPTISSSGRFISYVILRDIKITKSILIDLRDARIFEYEGLPANFSPDEKYFAFSREHDAFVCNTEDKKIIARHSFLKHNPHIETVLMSNTHIVIIWQGFYGTITVMDIYGKIGTYSIDTAFCQIKSRLYPDGTLLSVGTKEVTKIKLNFGEEVPPSAESIPPSVESVPPSVKSVPPSAESVPSDVEQAQSDVEQAPSNDVRSR